MQRNSTSRSRVFSFDENILYGILIPTNLVGYYKLKFMKFSTKAEYGLRAIAHLDKTGKKPVSLALIAEKEGISLAYLERIFAKLKKAKLIKAELGVKGGYLLIKPANQLTVYEIINTLEGSIAPMNCVVDKSVCPDCNCTIHPVWAELYKQMTKTLKGIKLNKIMK